MDSVVSSVRERIRSLLEPVEGVWSAYQGLDPEQQRSALLLALVGVGALVVWIMYQAHGDRVVVVLPAMLLRYSLLLVALPFVLVGRVAGARWSVPEFLRRDWTEEPDPDRAGIPIKEVNPMKLAGRLPSKRQRDRKNRERGSE